MPFMSLLAYIVNSMVAQDNDPRNIDRDIIRNYIVPRHITLEHHWSAVIGICHHDIADFLWPLLLTWFNFNPSMDK